MNSKQIVYLSQSQYAELIANGTITVNGVTVTYNENDIYVTPQAEPVTDVRINGTSIAANGVANIPVASDANLGVMRVAKSGGLRLGATNNLQVNYAANVETKAGADSFLPITPAYQHRSTFYGLAKASGDTTQSQSRNEVRTYTPEAKGAIQQMLGVSDLIGTSENDLVASKAYKVGEVFTANGKLYKATAAIAADAAIITDGANANCEEVTVADGFVKKTDYATSGNIENAGIVYDHQGTWGIKIISGNGFAGALSINPASASMVKDGVNASYPLTSVRAQETAFYGLAKAAGDTTQSQSDNAVGTYTDGAKAAIRTMLGVVGSEDVASSTTYGLVKVANIGVTLGSDNTLRIAPASTTTIKNSVENYNPIVPSHQHEATFYGLAKASGDTTQSSSSNAVGTYTDNAKASIKSMLGIVDGSTGTVNITGATPTINAVENTRYVCGEVTSLSFTPPSSGISIVRFTSGSTVTVLTIPSTVKFPEWFDPTALETNTIYEICVTDGTFGAVMSWAL